MADDFFDMITPEQAYDIGESTGRLHTEVEATNAFEMGEIELWIKFVEPKTIEEWEQWDADFGEEFGNRWKVDQGDNDE